MDGFKVISNFHPPEIDLMSTRNFFELSGKRKNGAIKFIYIYIYTYIYMYVCV